jgi:site-specific DNA recombinase
MVPASSGYASGLRKVPRMATNPKLLRCAIYTRKSTEHGLELEFNSLDAQREACEAYIKSQASQGWKAVPTPYDDPAFSGGNLDRPALKQLLADIEAGKIDVIVVYKIDRLTRSLADFAKLVEIFDARSISFVAVTQQFNTTSSMGRLTLNVLLSFAQFERELSSERVKDKIAASRRKGKWTGGTVPLGYETRDKKLILNTVEAETVGTIFRLYLELKSFTKLVAELDRRRIVTKRRNVKVAKYQGGIPFTYGPLAYLLKNRVYLGEVHHGGKWFKGEHKAILDRQTFDQVQETLKANVNGSRIKNFESGHLLKGKLYDDKGNRMGPSFSTKNGVRYRFYVSRALLRGRKRKAGLVSRVSAAEIEGIVENAVRIHFENPEMIRESIPDLVDRVTLNKGHIRIAFAPLNPAEGTARQPIDVPWERTKPLSIPTIPPPPSSADTDPKLLRAAVRAHGWLADLTAGRFPSVEDLANHAELHPKVIRQGLRLAFLAPHVTETILAGTQPRGVTLGSIPKRLPLRWTAQLSSTTKRN